LKPRQRGHRRRSRLSGQTELSITAFLNLMVVLVPFLLTTAVFSRNAVLTIEVPTPTPGVVPPPVPPPVADTQRFSLALHLEEAQVVPVVSGRRQAPVPRDREGGYDSAALRARLAAIKAEHPEEKAVDILSRPNTPYADLIAVMDATAGSAGAGGAALFPDVRLGDLAP